MESSSGLEGDDLTGRLMHWRKVDCFLSNGYLGIVVDVFLSAIIWRAFVEEHWIFGFASEALAI